MKPPFLPCNYTKKERAIVDCMASYKSALMRGEYGTHGNNDYIRPRMGCLSRAIAYLDQELVCVQIRLYVLGESDHQDDYTGLYTVDITGAFERYLSRERTNYPALDFKVLVRDIISALSYARRKIKGSAKS